MAATRIHDQFDAWLHRSPDRVFLHLRGTGEVLKRKLLELHPAD
ncbi:MAG TPA: hypothetical protein VLK85_19615 [Ramlibacter sp.]|nr:hypothetical protein [Ramlibacter sp.]